jgi:hypothetical protein
VKRMEVRAEEQRRAKQAADAEWRKQQRLREVQRAQVRAWTSLAGAAGGATSHTSLQRAYDRLSVADSRLTSHPCRRSWRGRGR